MKDRLKTLDQLMSVMHSEDSKGHPNQALEATDARGGLPVASHQHSQINPNDRTNQYGLGVISQQLGISSSLACQLQEDYFADHSSRAIYKDNPHAYEEQFTPEACSQALSSSDTPIWNSYTTQLCSMFPTTRPLSNTVSELDFSKVWLNHES